MPGAPRTTPIPVQQAIVDECGLPTEAFTQYLEELVGNATSTSGKVPLGTIVMYTGRVSDIPAGWALCNGENDTPDLNDRFIIGTIIGDEIGNTGGSATPTMPDHNHSMGHDHPMWHNHPMGHDHSIDHNHGSFNSSDNNSNHDHSGLGDTNWWQSNAQAGSGWTIIDSGTPDHTGNNSSNHDHTIDVPDYGGSSGGSSSGATGDPSEDDTGGSSSDNTGNKESGDQSRGNLPPYYTVAYIINVGTPNRRRR